MSRRPAGVKRVVPPDPRYGRLAAESFILTESVMVLSMVVLGGMGNVWGVILGAILLSFVPEILRYTVEQIGGVGPASQRVEDREEVGAFGD